MPVSFWLTIVLFVIIGFMLVNNFYWKNLREEHKYRVEKWKAQREGRTD